MEKIKGMDVKTLFEDNKRVEDCLVYKTKRDPNLELIDELNSGKKILSLGCGGGREVKELVQRKHKVTAIDLSENMIISSKKIEPNAEYFCADAVEFAREKGFKLKFDYILGLYAFLGYVDKWLMRGLIKDLMQMLNEGGSFVLELRRVTESPKYIFKSLIAPFFAIYFRQSWSFGDVYGRNAHALHEGWHKGHHFTERELKKLFNGYDLKINFNKVYVKNVQKNGAKNL
jgi:SAM-dependent methyltransferase